MALGLSNNARYKCHYPAHVLAGVAKLGDFPKNEIFTKTPLNKTHISLPTAVEINLKKSKSVFYD
jgi:hypothetical protein